MGYKLNCGIELTECNPGDSFVFYGHPHKLRYMGGRTHFDIEGKRQYMICQDGKEWDISKLTPTEETKRKVSERNQPKCKCGYVIPVIEITGGDLGSVENVLSSVFDLGEKKPQDVPEVKLDMKAPSVAYQEKTVVNIHAPEPLAQIIDWRGGEPHKPTDIAVNDNGDTATMLSIHQSIGKLGWNTIIRINTAAIPKQRTMTRTEIEREFGVKVVD